MKIVNKKRFIAVTITILFIIIGALQTIKAKTVDYVIIDYQVEKGNTLWQIAEENKQKGTDTRKYIQDIKQLNNMKNFNITTGQIIKIKKSI